MSSKTQELTRNGRWMKKTDKSEAHSYHCQVLLFLGELAFVQSVCLSASHFIAFCLHIFSFGLFSSLPSYSFSLFSFFVFLFILLLVCCLFVSS